jgi:hypothetical protein
MPIEGRDRELPTVVWWDDASNVISGIMSDLSDVQSRGLVTPASFGDMFFANENLTAFGERLYSLMKLERLPAADVEDLMVTLRPIDAPSSSDD